MVSAAGWWWELQKQCRLASDPSRSILPIKKMKVPGIKARRKHPSECNCLNLFCHAAVLTAGPALELLTEVQSRVISAPVIRLHRSFLLCSII